MWNLFTMKNAISSAEKYEVWQKITGLVVLPTWWRTHRLVRHTILICNITIAMVCAKRHPANAISFLSRAPFVPDVWRPRHCQATTMSETKNEHHGPRQILHYFNRDTWSAQVYHVMQYHRGKPCHIQECSTGTRGTRARRARARWSWGWRRGWSSFFDHRDIVHPWNCSRKAIAVNQQCYKACQPALLLHFYKFWDVSSPESNASGGIVERPKTECWITTNAPAHVDISIKQFLAEKQVAVLEHPPY